METIRTRGARNNARWCDGVCRSHGIRTRFDDDAWVAETRTPPLYPDAVTLVKDVDVSALLGRVDTTAGCSIKDSFAALDLTAHGFHVLFDADWIARVAPPSAPPRPNRPWVEIRDPERLSAWERAWRGADGPLDTFRPELLADDAIEFAGLFEGERVVAGAVLNAAHDVIGISNVFGVTAEAPETIWPGLLAFADARFPGRTFVGYESGAALAAAHRGGFASVGPLRVWITDD